MKKILTLVLTAFILSGLAVSLLACGWDSDSTAVTEEQVVTVQRGDLTIDITAIGNLAFSHQEELTFGVGGTVSEFLVEVGDSVEGGQVLAELDASKWEEQLDVLERNLTTAEDKLTSAERNLTTAERNATSAERKLATKESSLLQAEINLKNAQLALDKAESNWQITEEEVEIKELQVELTGMRLEEAQNAVVDAEQDIVDAQQAIVDAEQDIVDAQQTVADAQQELDEANTVGLVISAPFAGLITAVNVSTGDVVKESRVAVIITDPTEFEADILVNEMDIFNIRLGAQANIQVDAIPMLNLPAKVTRIASTAIIQAGVVNYKVRVEIESLETVMQERQEAMPEVSAGELPERIKRAIEEGRITQEQAEEMMRRMQEGGMPLPSRGGRLPMMIPENFQLREGLTVTVSIILEERNDVLLVPNAAITSSGGQTYVKVVSPDGVIEDRLVTTGISDWQYTEIIDGLSEGEKVVIPETATTPTTPQPGERTPFFPRGMGR